MSDVPTISRFAGEWAFLSNFYPSPIVWEQVSYPTAEHAFNAGKTIMPSARLEIAGAPTPGQAKALGRHAPLRPAWDTVVRYQVMREVLAAKFANPRLLVLLLSTGNARLVEGNTWHDQHWGSCSCGRPACAPAGRNWLGTMLMALRDEHSQNAAGGD